MSVPQHRSLLPFFFNFLDEHVAATRSPVPFLESIPMVVQLLIFNFVAVLMFLVTSTEESVDATLIGHAALPC